MRPDRLSALIQRFRIEAKVLPVGVNDTPGAWGRDAAPNFFILRRGRLKFSDEHFPDLNDQAPVLVFFPRGAPSGFNVLTDAADAEVVCASVDTGGAANPIALALSDVVSVSLDEANL